MMQASGGCKRCGNTHTSQWRAGYRDEKLCNTCGLAYKKNMTRKVMASNLSSSVYETRSRATTIDSPPVQDKLIHKSNAIATPA